MDYINHVLMIRICKSRYFHNHASGSNDLNGLPLLDDISFSDLVGTVAQPGLIPTNIVRVQSKSLLNG